MTYFRYILLFILLVFEIESKPQIHFGDEGKFHPDLLLYNMHP